MPSKPGTPRTLGFAVWSDDVALVRELLDVGVRVDDYGSDTTDVTPLMESVNELEPFYDADRVVVTQLLLSAGADVSRRDKTGRTALHYAVGAGRKAVEILLAAEADVDAEADGGVTPLHEAVTRGNPAAIEALCRGGANRGARDGLGRTPAGLLAEDEDTYTPQERAALNAMLAG
ncbi:ankyrin repeat domain-containing protein [Arthrobacter celericrescens]|uniref:ankyrin repeat domain-containing protein n=1 Tax=Arthrobacter celericrescens TaxID=2320851 RepID=UPI000EA18197|nr:ankyrin repeat domain-containing protein [Arthrobacter celericrescens]